MNALEWTKQILADAKALSPTEFVGKYPHPFLLGEPTRAATPEDIFATCSAPAKAVTGEREPLASPTTSVVPVKKCGSNPFVNMVTIGRALNNDVCLVVPSVSKFHAFIMQSQSGWRLVDAGSQNGTYVKTDRLAPQTPTSLADGESIFFGPDAHYRFYEAETLYHLIRGFFLAPRSPNVVAPQPSAAPVSA